MEASPVIDKCHWHSYLELTIKVTLLVKLVWDAYINSKLDNVGVRHEGVALGQKVWFTINRPTVLLCTYVPISNSITRRDWLECVVARRA